ncbi:MAG: hypothetical protein QOI20_867 [Acidimicrobiaceae bacterium]|jgi:hypothetical protein|nr:hypothetical protein [Acidimicrobiaceae bacterium]
MKKSIDFAFDDHPAPDDSVATATAPADDDRRPVAWSVSLFDDCEGCDDLRVELVLEEQGRPGAGVAAHLAPATARRLRAAIAAALKDLGEQPGP